MTLYRIPCRSIRTVAALGGLALLAACGGGSSGPTPSASAMPCTDATNATLTLVSPAAGATGVATTTTAVSLQASAPIPGTVEFELVDKNGAAQLGGQIAGGNPYSASGFTLVAGDTYNVYVLNTAQAGCTAQPIAGATFST